MQNCFTLNLITFNLTKISFFPQSIQPQSLTFNILGVTVKLGYDIFNTPFQTAHPYKGMSFPGFMIGYPYATMDLVSLVVPPDPSYLSPKAGSVSVELNLFINV